MTMVDGRGGADMDKRSFLSRIMLISQHNGVMLGQTAAMIGSLVNKACSAHGESVYRLTLS
jgi:hypothetical protein